jgi:hypothetical protein
MQECAFEQNEQDGAVGLVCCKTKVVTVFVSDDLNAEPLLVRRKKSGTDLEDRWII